MSPKQSTAPAESPAPTVRPFVVAICITGCTIGLEHGYQFAFFGGDVISDQVLVKYAERDSHFQSVSFADRTAYQAWLAERDAKLAALQEQATPLGFELRRHGEVTKTTRGLKLHGLAHQKPER